MSAKFKFETKRGTRVQLLLETPVAVRWTGGRRTEVAARVAAGKLLDRAGDAIDEVARASKQLDRAKAKARAALSHALGMPVELPIVSSKDVVAVDAATLLEMYPDGKTGGRR